VITKAVIPAFAGLAFARVADRVTRHSVMCVTVAILKSGNQQGHRTHHTAQSQVRYPTGLPDPSFNSARFFASVSLPSGRIIPDPTYAEIIVFSVFRVRIL
jgi:hypothetical protein